MKKKDDYVEVFMGTTYVTRSRTIGQFKSLLEEIIEDLPADDDLEIAEVDLRDGKLSYVLKEGIQQ